MRLIDEFRKNDQTFYDVFPQNICGSILVVFIISKPIIYCYHLMFKIEHDTQKKKSLQYTRILHCNSATCLFAL